MGQKAINFFKWAGALLFLGLSITAYGQAPYGYPYPEHPPEPQPQVSVPYHLDSPKSQARYEARKKSYTQVHPQKYTPPRSKIAIKTQPLSPKEFHHVPMIHKHSKILYYPLFTGLYVGRGVDVIANANQPVQHVEVLSTSLQALEGFRSEIENGILHLYLTHRPKDNERILVKISLEALNTLDYVGDGFVEVNQIQHNTMMVKAAGSGEINLLGPKVRLQQLDCSGDVHVRVANMAVDIPVAINYSGTGNVEFGGVINLRSLNVSGQGNLSLYWIDTPRLEISGNGLATARLAGIADNISINAYHRSHIDTRFLRSNVAYVKTYNFARVDVAPKYNLFADAQNFSNIYFFNRPHFVTAETHESGAVLGMADIHGAVVTFP